MLGGMTDMADGDEDLTIRLKADNTDALAKAGQVGKSFDKATAAANKAAKDQTRISSSSATDRVKNANKAADAEVARWAGPGTHWAGSRARARGTWRASIPRPPGSSRGSRNSPARRPGSGP